MSNNNYVIPPLAQMPIKGSKNAPEKFKGGYKHVTPFIDRYNHLLEYYHGTSDEDKCRGILEYCSQSVKDFIQINPYFLAPNWAKLQDEILNAYDAERMNFRICSRDFFDFVGQSHKSQIVNLSQWKKYHHEYIAKAGFLKQNGQLDNFQYDGYYWHGVPKHLQGIFELRLQSKFPTFDNSEPYPISSVQDIAQTYFKQSKFSSHLPHLPMLGFEEEEEEEEEDTV
jgi:hypothetical protein